MEIAQVVENIGEHWSRLSVGYDERHDTEDLDAWRGVLKDLLGTDQNKSVLDLGAGTGFLCNMTAELGYCSIGLDASTEMLKHAVRHAKSRGTNAVYMKGNALDLPFMDDSIDEIVNCRLIWTLVNPDEAIQEWMRVLKPGGSIFCFNRMQDDVGLTMTDGGFYGNDEVDGALAIRAASMDELKALMTRNGLVDVEIVRLPQMTLPDWDYEPWYLLRGTKPVTKREREESGMANYWDASAENYDATHEVADKDVWKQVLEGLIGPKRDLRILDIATGTGLIANMLAGHGYCDVTGVDLSEGMMKFAAQQALRDGLDVTYGFGNALELPFDDATFDVVINSRLLWTLTEPDAAIREWARVLAPGGKLIAINELEPDVGIRCSTLDDYRVNTGADDLPFSNVDSGDIIALLEAAGLAEAGVQHMAGCHLRNSDRENWFAFTAIKN